MKLGLALLATSAMMFAAPAFAQQAGETPAQNSLDRPSLSDTEAGQADWYRQFAVVKSQVDHSSSWQTEPSDDTNFAWSQGKRWQLSIDLLSRPETSPLPREEMQAGATFKITPRLSIGGEVRVGAHELDDSSQWEEQQIEAGIRLKSAYKF